MDHVPSPPERIYTAQLFSALPQCYLLFIVLQLSDTPSTLTMNTRKKNKSAHPGIPDMTPLQLSSAGLSRASTVRRPAKKKLTKDQQIAALEDELRSTRELILTVIVFCTRVTMCLP